jgi:hypothetical protein
MACAPDEFEIGGVEFARQNIVDERLRPGEDRRQALLLGQLLLGLGGGRLTVWVRAWGEIEKAKQTMRASASSNGPSTSGSFVWMKVFATPPGTNLARLRRPRSPSK